MIKEINLASWNEFEAHVQAIRKQVAHPNALLFRGQRDAAWRLDTTLDRQFGEPVSAHRYYRLVAVAQPQVETFTSREWAPLEYSEVEKWAKDYDSINTMKIPAYEFLIYLRHHSFPSPLLDWTRSPYVAAYFAFAHAVTGSVAVYVYSEYGKGGKASSSAHPRIKQFGSYVRGHSRHFLQQSEYTSCVYFDSDENEFHFVPHDDVFETSIDGDDQDLLWKFTFPASERIDVLRRLDAHNLNAFSLFQTDEALLETIALREIELR